MQKIFVFLTLMHPGKTQNSIFSKILEDLAVWDVSTDLREREQ